MEQIKDKEVPYFEVSVLTNDPSYHIIEMVDCNCLICEGRAIVECKNCQNLLMLVMYEGFFYGCFIAPKNKSITKESNDYAVLQRS